MAGAAGLGQFRKVLQELKTNAQSKIKQLTELAERHKESGDAIPRCLAEEIHKAEAARLQPLFLVLDSIMKKLGKEYRTHLTGILPQLMQAAYNKADPQQKKFLQKIANESWKKHQLLPPSVSEKLDAVFAGRAPAASPGQVKMEVLQQPQQASSFVAVKDEAGRPGKAPGGAPAGAAASGPPRVKGPPPKPPVKIEAQADNKAASATSAGESSEVLERRLMILTKIMERKGPAPEELREIMRVPEVVKAMALQRTGSKEEAMALLSSYKADLEKSAKQSQARQLDPRQAGKPVDPRAADPRQQADKKDARPQDPRQAAAQKLIDPKNEVGTNKRAAESQDPRRPAKAARKSPDADMICIDDDDDGTPGKDDEVEVVPEHEARAKVLQGLPSLGFSEGWMRQFLEQMPVSNQTSDPEAAATKQTPTVGRKVLSAEGDQMVYVDELSPSEILLLMQLVFLLEEKLRRSGGPGSGQALDVTQRIPHTFSYLQVDPAIDVMLQRFFDDVPYQCQQTGLRFATRDKLRKHNDALIRRRAAKQQRQGGAEARGWMETIPEWVGNRDLVVGPALFQLGGAAAADEVTVQKANRAALEDAGGSDGEDEEGSERSRWICPYDERRSVCPISGEPFEIEWNESLNDWAFSNVVAVELGTTNKVLRFPPKGPKDPERLTESALLFKKSCFVNTTPTQRLASLEDCRSVHAHGVPSVVKRTVTDAVSPAEKAELDQLAAMLKKSTEGPKRTFF